MAAPTDVPARRRIDRYVLQEELGRGGMGVVHAAYDTQLERRVALKVLPPGLAADTRYVARFEQEMRVAASLGHPNIVPVHEIGRRDGNLFIAMALIEGEDLRTVIAREGPLAPPRVARIVRQIGSALDAAHGRGLIHRDVKPANVLLTGDDEDEHAYLVDFGLAREAAAESQLTAPGEWIGTLDYAAPEQIAAVPLRPAADVYALACVAFSALTGTTPFGGSTAAKMAAHLHEPLPTVGGPLAPAVDPVLARATHKDPSHRHASAGEFGRDLAAAIREGAPTARAVAAAPAGRRPLRPALLAAGALGAGMLAATVALALGGGDDERSGTTAAADRDGRPASSTQSPSTRSSSTASSPRESARPRAPKPPAAATYTAPNGGYTALVPAGDGWVNRGEQDLGGILRTVFTGPDGAQMWIDATPRIPPTFGTEGRSDITTEQYTTAVGTVRAYRFRGPPDFCMRGCLDDQLDRGGHGFAVMGGPTPEARLAARRAMRSLRPASAGKPPREAQGSGKPEDAAKPGTDKKDKRGDNERDD